MVPHNKVRVDLDFEEFDDEMTLSSFIAHIERTMAVLNTVPDEYRDTIKIRVRGYEDSYVTMYGEYVRDKTPEEFEQEQRKSEFEAQSKERQERLMLERLKAKYEPLA